MADESQLVLETDHHYVAICRVDGPARSEDGTLCVLEVGRGSDAPHDTEAAFLPLDKDGAAALVAAIQAAIPSAN